MIKAVLFDLDGTLLNRDASVKAFIDNQYDRLKNWVGHVPKEHYMTRFIELDKRGYVWKDAVYQQLTQEFTISTITWEELLQDYIREFQFHCVPFDQLLQMLEDLKSKNILLGMITNGYGQFQMDNIKALGIENYFDVILVSEWEDIKKPDPEIFKRALRKLDVSSKHSIFVGDHPENDVKAAQDIGMKGIWKNDSQWANVDADFTVDDLKELPLLVEDLMKEIEVT
ncbi:2-haloalkanoic acid dehalogenase [Planococcus halocryophilus Or1]|uniref:L-2-haloalkanoic acid dehalogenase n=1 Tax=Planococcus halocryophilus TaxID=1215089 RepID=A0A1C7DNW0_9BACL|nr:HAD family hydrolase [Planococcus halocryophilus]ANU13092.1 L-2-haloalkanoic acid dehalogenase [Planococcus halocryophilus]EMF47895.1 2-haloalkanoic acid dehalogenase [Planococcus halocryophilus Or1]